MGRDAPGAALAGLHGFAPGLTSFVGRAEAVAEVAALVGECRLVTVTGPGGVGKTRLAGEVAASMADQFADGVWLVELAGVAEPALLEAAVATALGVGVGQASRTSLRDSLVMVVAARQLLLVLDSCEHLLAAAAALCGTLLGAAADVRVLATSREPVGVPGEARYRLGPLSLPGAGPAGAGMPEAVALFADRARRADPHFTLGPELTPAVAKIVTGLDGMPLAIELAAARVESLGVTQLAGRLDDRLRLLAGADRLAAARHRSLAAAAEWSYRLLGEDERRVFRLVSAFPGPFTLEAAEAIAGADAGPAVLHLVDCSLLAPPRPGVDGRARYLMLDTLRAYAAERLGEAGEQEEAAAALAGYALEVAEQAAAGLAASAGELAAAQWLNAEDATMHQALTWALGHDRDAALRLGIALAPWWSLRGREDTGYKLLAAAAGLAETGSPAWCEAQVWLGELAPVEDLAVGLGHFAAARDALAGGGPSLRLVRALNGGAECLGNLGRSEEAEAGARRALAMAREVGYPPGEADALLELGVLAHYAADSEASLGWLRQAQQVDPKAMPGSQARICRLYLAKALREIPDQAEAARQACGQALAWARQAGAAHHQADCLQLMADLDLAAGRLPQARTHLREAIDTGLSIGDRFRLLECADHCAHLCAQTRRYREALTMWAARAAHLRATQGLDLPLEARRRQEPLATARRALGPAAATAAEERGAAMTLTAAGEYALLLTTAPDEQAVAPGLPQLSAREKELVTLVAQGITDAQIAQHLYISVRTVRSHLDRIRDKTGCRRRADLTRLALQADLI